MALTRAQLLMGDGGQGVVLSNQAQGVRPGGNGITIRPDGVIEVNSQTIVGVMKLGQTPGAAAAAYNGYTWPTGPGAPGQQLETNGAGILSWADADGIDWTQKGQLIVGTGVGTDVLLNAGPNLSMLIVDSSTPSGLNYTNAVDTAMQAPAGTTLQRPIPPDLSAGQIRFNDDTDKFEFYNGTDWEEIASGNPVPGGNTFVIQTIPFNNLTETGTALIPAGTTAQQQTLPAPVDGALRFNTTIGQLEVWDTSAWEGIPSSSTGTFVEQTIPTTGSGSAVIPVGTTADRQSAPVPLEGYTRFNSTTKYLEYFDGTRWIENSGGVPDLGLNLEVTNSLIKTKVPEAASPISAGIGPGQAIIGSTYYDTNLGSTFVYYSNGGTPVWVMT